MKGSLHLIFLDSHSQESWDNLASFFWSPSSDLTEEIQRQGPELEHKTKSKARQWKLAKGETYVLAEVRGPKIKNQSRGDTEAGSEELRTNPRATPREVQVSRCIREWTEINCLRARRGFLSLGESMFTGWSGRLFCMAIYLWNQRRSDFQSLTGEGCCIHFLGHRMCRWNIFTSPKLSQTHCCGLSSKGLHWLTCLNAWPIGSSTFRRCGFVKKYITAGAGFEISEPQTKPNISQYFFLLL